MVGGTVGLMPDDDGSQTDAQASVTITQSDEYYLKVEHISGRGHAGSVPAGHRRRGHGSAADHVDQQASGRKVVRVGLVIESDHGELQ